MQAIELPVARALLAALPPAAELVRRPEVALAWPQPSGVERYTVGGLAGHLLRAAGRLEPTLDAPPVDGPHATFTEWYLDNRVAGPEDLDGDFAVWLRDDGEQLAAQGPSAVAEELDALAGRLHERLAGEDADRTVKVVLTERAVPLADYLASRLVEVVVHADDIATGAGTEPPAFDGAVLRAGVAVLAEMARARSGGIAVIRALTRAERVEDPYDVLRVL